jgi:hypothetical protein
MLIIYTSIKNNGIILDLDNPKKKHGGIQFILTNDAPHLANIVIPCYKLFPHQCLYLQSMIILINKAEVQNLSRRINKIFSLLVKTSVLIH